MEYSLISGSSHYKLTENISKLVNIPIDEIKSKKFHNTETNVCIMKTQRKRHVFIVQTGAFSNINDINDDIKNFILTIEPTLLDDTTYINSVVNSFHNNFDNFMKQYRSIDDYLTETRQLIRACHLSGAEEITLIMPFFPYSRSDKRELNERSAISAKLEAELLEKSGSGKLKRIITLDLHAGQEVGFTNKANFDNLYALPLFIDYLDNNLFHNLTLSDIQNNYIFVSPDAGGEKRTKAWADAYNMDGYTCTKTRDAPSSIGKIKFCGDKEIVRNKTVIIIDDMIDSGNTMMKTAEILINECNAKTVILAATHGLFTNNALTKVCESKYISQVIVTNSLPQDNNIKKCKKLTVIDCSPLLSQVIKIKINYNNNRENDSITNLFKVKPFNIRKQNIPIAPPSSIRLIDNINAARQLYNTYVNIYGDTSSNTIDDNINDYHKNDNYINDDDILIDFKIK